MSADPFIPPLLSAADFGAAVVPLLESKTDAELPIISATSFAGRNLPERPWIIKDMIPGRTVTIVTGDGGEGKTTLKLQLCAAMASGRAWLGYNPEHGRALFLSAEDDQDELHRRVASIAASLGVTLAQLSDLYLVPPVGQDAVMGVPEGRAPIIAPTAVFRGLVDLVERIKPRLVVLDALADVYAGDENSRTQVRQFVSQLRSLAIQHDLAIVLIAHPSLTGMTSGNGTSGSSAWSNSARARLYLERMKDNKGREIDSDLRMLRVKKSNYGPLGVELRLRWQNGAFILDDKQGDLVQLAAQATAERVFLDLLAVYESQDRDVSPNRGPTYAPTEFAKHPDVDGVAKRALEDAMANLLKAKRIRVATFGPPSKQRKRLRLVERAQ